MSQENKYRNGCKDVFHAFMVQNASYESEMEIPRIKPQACRPKKLVPFSKVFSRSEFDAWVHFYEDDAAFERLWNKPSRYLPILKRFEGVIAPDFSVYRDMPLVMQYWNIYRSHAVASWLQDNNIPVIANVRWGDERSYRICCAGVPNYSIIAVGSHGCIKLLREREYFCAGLEYIIRVLQPKAIVVYGTAPDSVFGKYEKSGIEILRFESDYMAAHRKVANS